MRDNDGRKLDHATLEQMRFRAVDAVEAGAHPEDVAKMLGMHAKTVYGWLARAREGGRDALKAKPVPGRPPKLDGSQLRRLYTLIVGTNPRQLQFDFELWTRAMVREVIRREFGVHLSEVSVGRLLRKLGLSPQRPLWRAWQADPEAVERWKAEEFPAIRAAAKAEGATVYFADEAGIRSDYHAGTTWAPVGRTPVVKATGARHSLNMISALTPAGKLRFATYTGSFTADQFISFCKKLLADTGRDGGGGVYLVVDGHSTHKAKKVKEFIASTDGRLKVFILPAYSPQLNPDEWVWKNVKHDRVGRTAPRTAEEFKSNVIAALHRLQKLPHLVRGFFADPDLRYITA
ncbi:IS630 family transposase [Georgenia sp. TF02-10]|uniref:IS630 family transposase n=1 Tax=Georgenia sp. TF02-10 TaxID=2917725 RepID=UPI001FA7058B|nr:IS630 family transposase [Georgenia sp. TF02-10]UNX53172.1 IS630 family transposase [Georgenia sp. TF02-10]UNX53588.1 IS630 family transposase [Georgenia sp. TF02-10]UNX53729.1 IS630 family transposase [Georgenia sp. TF02-10]UNX53794.1 IS630 family transposase [Georgenia sp. TF02-10]UNX54639.1 IS630 family transposase [Georgenia sp. TF02-10]